MMSNFRILVNTMLNFESSHYLGPLSIVSAHLTFAEARFLGKAIPYPDLLGAAKPETRKIAWLQFLVQGLPRRVKNASQNPFQDRSSFSPRSELSRSPISLR
jgi:hypothetical protein